MRPCRSTESSNPANTGARNTAIVGLWFSASFRSGAKAAAALRRDRRMAQIQIPAIAHFCARHQRLGLGPASSHRGLRPSIHTIPTTSPVDPNNSNTDEQPISCHLPRLEAKDQGSQLIAQMHSRPGPINYRSPQFHQCCPTVPTIPTSSGASP